MVSVFLRLLSVIKQQSLSFLQPWFCLLQGLKCLKMFVETVYSNFFIVLLINFFLFISKNVCIYMLQTNTPSQLAPASLWWKHCKVCDRIGLLEHSSSRLDFEVHWTLLRKIGPLPVPKKASLCALPSGHKSVIVCTYMCGYILTCKLTSISQLSTNYSSISVVPVVITHCSPLVIDAHLHSTLILIGASHQTNISIGTVANGIHCSKKQWHN